MTDTITDDRAVALADLPPANAMVPTDRRLLPAPMEALAEVANMLASAGALVPKDLRGKPDVCLAVAYMAALHGTDPVATASQTYLVGDKIAFMAQYINALVQRHFIEKPVYTYQGSGATRCVMVTAKVKGGQVISVTTPQLGQIKVQNSPLWKTDPDQQLSYYAIRALARRHMPDVLLGIYAVEELQNVSIRDVTPPPADPFRDDEEIEEVTPEIDGAEPATFEPSGGFTTDAPAEPYATSSASPQQDVADDIIAWGAATRADAEAATTRADLDAIWEGCEANRRKLYREDRVEYDALERAFIDRAAAISDVPL